MKVKELIEKLQSMPQDLEVRYVWDGEDRSAVEEIIVAKSGGFDFIIPDTPVVMLLSRDDYLWQREKREIK